MNPPVATPSPGTPDAVTPRVWLVTGYRAGERSQILALAEALGWPYELKELSYRRSEFRTSLLRGSDLRGIRLDRSSTLEPPWPDLVISAGMRNEPVCRWIRDQNAGRTRIVHLGRPWARPDNFDLIVTTPQYRLAAHPKVLHNVVTLHRLTPQRLAAAGEHWAERFAHLPKPWLAVILGGNSGPYTLGPKNAASIARRVNRLAEAQGYSLLVSTSARTSPAAARAFEDQLSVPYYIHHWRAQDLDNPYFGILALCDAAVVTADSISMLSEACATGKPVYIADLGGYGYAMRPGHAAPRDFRFSAMTYSFMMACGPQRLSRDLRLVHRELVNSGRAVWLDETFNRPPVADCSDLERAVQRVRALFPGML